MFDLVPDDVTWQGAFECTPETSRHGQTCNLHIVTTSACVKHFADCPAIYRHWAGTLPGPDMIRWGAGVVAGDPWGKLHCMQMWDVSSPCT